jgi:hypothetical protein
MSAPELERSLRALAAEIEWPETPELHLELARQRRRPRRLALVLVLAALLVALAAALAVPSARTAILRFFHLRGATVELVDTLPAADERPLGAGLGPIVGAAEAERDLGFRFLFPPGGEHAPIHVRGGIGSVLLAGREPILLTELNPGGGTGPELLKKIAGTGTNVEPVSVRGQQGLWLSGGAHIFFTPATPPRLAGNVLLWEHGALTLRLEGKHLTKAEALAIARSIE